MLHAFHYQLTPQREARTVSLILEPPPRSLASVPGLGIRKDIRIADEGLAAGVRYRLRNDGEEAISLQFTSASNIGLLSEAEPRRRDHRRDAKDDRGKTARCAARD